MDRQTLRDWVHRFNEDGPDALIDRKPGGTAPRLTPAQLDVLAPPARVKKVWRTPSLSRTSALRSAGATLTTPLYALTTRSMGIRERGSLLFSVTM